MPHDDPPRAVGGGARDRDPPAEPSPSPKDLAGAVSVAGAIFAALVGADPFDIHNRAHLVADLDYLALAFWAGALLLFLFAAVPVPPRAARPAGTNSGSGEGKSELNRLSTRSKLALLVAGVAGALTVVGLVMVPFGFSVDRDDVALKLSPSARDGIDQLCGTAGRRLTGKIPTTSLHDDFVIFTFQKRTKRGCDVVRIPRAAILALEEHPCERITGGLPPGCPKPSQTSRSH